MNNTKDPIEKGDVIGFLLNFEANNVTFFYNGAEKAVITLVDSLTVPKRRAIYPVVGISFNTTVIFTQKRFPPK